MNVTIHQPCYLPWIPFLEKGLQSDVYVLLDDVQFEKNGVQHRNRIKTAQGEVWLTVPVSRSLHTRLPEVRIAGDHWRRKHWRTIEESYRAAPHFAALAEPLRAIIETPGESLLDLVVRLDEQFLDWAGFRGRLVRASELSVAGEGSQRVLDLCRAVGGTKYFAGRAGIDYLDLPAFAAAGIEVVFQRYEHAPYPQRYPEQGFLPHLAALDLLMNVGIGEPAREFMLANRKWATAEEIMNE